MINILPGHCSHALSAWIDDLGDWLVRTLAWLCQNDIATRDHDPRREDYRYESVHAVASLVACGHAVSHSLSQCEKERVNSVLGSRALKLN